MPGQYYKNSSNKIDNEFDASGLKWSKTATIEDSVTVMLYYGPFIYVGGDLSKVLTTEGYIDTQATNRYHYYLKDHLGNTRMTINYSGTTVDDVQTVEYYPFGSIFSENGLDKNLYLYNGKELNNEFFENYDYGARFYDAELGRFHTLDPLTEKYNFQTPYAYASNDPVRFIDVMGMKPGAYGLEDEIGAINYSGPLSSSDDKDKKYKKQVSATGMIKDAFMSLFLKDDPIDVPDDLKEDLPFQGEKAPRDVRSPDLYGFYVGGKFFVVGGAGGEEGIVWVKDDKGGMFITGKLGAGSDVSAGGGIILGWFQGEEKPTLESFEGGAFYIDKSGKIIDIGVSVDYNYKLKQAGRQWKTISIGVSTGMFNPLPNAGSSGFSGTVIGPID